MRRALAPVLILAALAAGCTTPDGRELKAEFLNAGDLVVRADVQSSDAEVGTITSIDLEDRGERWVAVVTMRLEEGTPVPVGTGALVRSTSLLGEKYVDLVVPEDASASTPEIPDGGVIPFERTDNVPELEEVFQQLGGILASGALEDLGRFTSALAVIVEGREENIGRVFDGTADLVSSIHAQREALAGGLDRLRSAAGTLADGGETVDRFLTTSDDAVAVLASQRGQLAELITQLDRIGAVGARLMDEHKDDVDAQLTQINDLVPKVFEVRDVLSAAVAKLPPFTELFARAAPGDYIQLDILGEGEFPDIFGAAAADAPGDPEDPLSRMLWGAAR